MTRVARMRGSYRLRLVFGYLLVVTVLAGAWAWSLFGPLTDIVIEQQQAHLQGVAQAGALVLSDSTLPAERAIRELVADTDLRMTLIAADGTVIADSAEEPASMENHANRPEVATALGGGVGRDVRRSATQGFDQMYVAVPATHEGEGAAIRVSESLSRIADISAGARRSGLLLLAMSVLIALTVAVRAAHNTARPVERLAAAAGRMAAGDLSLTIPSEKGALEPLSDALCELRSQMQDRIGDLVTEQENLRAVLDGLTSAVILLDDRRVRLVNRAATTMFRLMPGEIKDRDIAQIKLPASLSSAISSAIAEGSPVTRDIGPDPLQRYLRLTVLPLGAGSGSSRHLVLVADVTDRMRLDSVRRDFVANASHELKTPTSGILLLAESASTAAADGDTATALAFLGQIEAEASRMRGLVLDLLDLSRLESTADSSKTTDMRQAIDLSLSAHRRAALAKEIDLSADFSEVDGVDAYVRADGTDVAIALDNLLANAIAYTDTGSVSVALEADDEDVIVSVTDTGIGIPPEDLPRVFERFYRVDRARSRDSGGTGLGLSLVRHVVERSGGEIDIRSKPGSGTTVTVRLPRAH